MDFQEADSQCSPWPTVSLSFLSSFPSVQILKTPFPLTKPSLQYTSSNKEIGNVCFLSCLFLCFFGAYSSFTAMSWKWIMVSRCLDGPYSPQRGVTHHLDWWWQWWRWCCWWRQWRWWCWWSSAINCILWSQYPVMVKTKSQIKTSDYLNLYEMDFTFGSIQISL